MNGTCLPASLDTLSRSVLTTSTDQLQKYVSSEKIKKPERFQLTPRSCQLTTSALTVDLDQVVAQHDAVDGAHGKVADQERAAI